jgi:putative spermidine/putrescine transport system ATP-binding protein
VSADSGSHGASITLRRLTKRYGDVTAVDGIDLEAQPGEFLTLLGPSGSGKTTTLNMIAGFETVTEGDLHIDGAPVQSLPPYKRNIGMVFQHYALFPHMSVSDNVAYPLKQRKVPRGERRELVDGALKTVGLSGLGHRMPKQLSGGQQQRVALARAMVYSPRVLLMDEPLGALDKKLRDSLQLEIKRIHAELGTTFVYVTHDQDEALVLSDRIAVFNDGRIEQVGTAQDLYDRPESVFVAQFLGESALFHGTAAATGNGCGLSGSEGVLRAGRGVLTEGSPATLVVRPERLRVLPRGSDRPSGNAVPGRITQQIYLGNSRKLLVQLTDGGTIPVRESSGSGSACRVDDDVWVTFRDEDAAVLAAAPPSVAAGQVAVDEGTELTPV